MRPINLIPPEERRGQHAPLRAGPLAYVVVAALVAVLAGVTALVLTGNEISDREAELARVESDDAAEAAKAERLSAYTSFRDLSEQRVVTVQSLADSRFDWERVMRELALILPGDVWLVGLTATASPEVSVEGGASSGSDLRGSVPGPALELTGCATGQQAVAGFVTALKDIDGVTRVGVQSSELGQEDDSGSAVGTGAASSSGGEECRTRASIAKFELVVAFDAAPISEVASSASGAAPAAKPEPEPGSGAETETASNESGEGG